MAVSSKNQIGLLRGKIRFKVFSQSRQLVKAFSQLKRNMNKVAIISVFAMTVVSFSTGDILMQQALSSKYI